MNWHRSPELLDRLAAEYALGTLNGGARRRFEAVMREHPAVARAAARWDMRLEPMAAQLPALRGSDRLWSRIEQRTSGRAASASTKPGVGSWLRRWFGPVPSAALSLGLMLGLGAPALWQVLNADPYDTQLPESYVGVLATADGQPGLIVSSLRRGKTVDLKVLRAEPLTGGQALFLWTLDKQGVAQPVGPLPAFNAGFVSFALGRTSEEAFARAVELAVSVEAAGASPQAPNQPYAYRGLCGKLWRTKPAR